MNKSPSFNLRSLTELGGTLLHRVVRYAVVLFLLLLAGIYGFLLLRVSSLSNAQPSDNAVTSNVKASSTPHIDPGVVKQMQDLQDNSVSVKTLFNNARRNPFQE